MRLDLPGPLARSPFHRTRLTGLEDTTQLARLPLTRREDILQDQLAHLPHGTRRLEGAPPPVRVGITGTGESLLVLAWSAADLARERAAGVRLLRRLGVTPGMHVANTLPGALATPGSLLLGDVVEELGGLDVPLGTEDARQAWELVDRVRPDVIVLDDDPAFLAAAPPADRPWWRGIVRLRTDRPVAPVPVPSAAGFAGWERTWLAVPEVTSFVAGSCRAGRFHVDEGVVAEVVGAALVLTVLDLDAPVLRYLTGLAARLPAGPCACGTDGVTLEAS